MLRRVRQLLAPPVFEGDGEKTRTARLLNTILLSALAIIGLTGLLSPLLYTDSGSSQLLLGTLALLTLAVLVLMRRGHVRVAAVSFLFLMWVMMTVSAFAYGGVRGSSYSSYFIIILIAALLLGGRAGFGFAGLSIAAGLGLLYLETHGLLPPPASPITALDMWTGQTMNFIMAAVLLFLATRSLGEALENLRRSERALASRTRDLEQRNRQLLALQSAGAAITSVLDLPHVLETVTREMAGLLEVETCAISEWNRAEASVARLALFTAGAGGLNRQALKAVLPLADCPRMDRVLEEASAQQVTASQPEVEPAELAYMRSANIGTLLILPMVFQKRVVGLVEVMDRAEQTFTEAEVSLAQLLANQAASAIENARQYEQARREIAERQRAEAALQTYAVKLEQSNRELQDFLYAASHDLQEPLRKVQAFGDRLQSQYGEVLDARAVDYLARMRNAAGRMRTLINDLLVYSRVTNRSEPFRRVNLAQMARGVVDDFAHELQQLGGWVEIGDLPAIEADPVQMRHLLKQLVGNAIKFHCKERSLAVHIGSAQPGDNGSGPDLCHITVADNGIGFEDKYVDRIFQVFGRLHARHEYEGTGMGLAVCRKIVENHGGRITARGRPGQGATFEITLPVRQAVGGRE